MGVIAWARMGVSVWVGLLWLIDSVWGGVGVSVSVGVRVGQL